LNYGACSGEGDASGYAELREQVTLQPNTQRKMGLNCHKLNKQPISLVEPKDKIGLVCIAQENALAADLNRPRYLTGEEQRYYPRPMGRDIEDTWPIEYMLPRQFFRQ